ncbi:MAG: GNAT family N-acetyltransferase [Alphaproteobacteria bacterium]
MKPYNDPWLSEILKTTVFRIGGDDDGDTHPPLPTPCFAYAKVKTDDTKSAKLLSDFGFFIVDTNVSFVFKKPLNFTSFTSDILVRSARIDDKDKVCAIAETSFSLTRFHADPYIDNAIANRIKSEWAENYFSGERGDLMLVAEIDGEVVGFNQVLVRDDVAIIDLIAVERSAQGQGVGKALIYDLQNRFDQICVGTQISNKHSIALYEKMGFHFHDSQYVMHYHTT